MSDTFADYNQNTRVAGTLSGKLTVLPATGVNDAPQVKQVTSWLTITSGTLPNTGAWVSDTAKQNPVARQITVMVEVVGDGTSNVATVTVAVSPDNSTYTTVATPSIAAAVNNTGAITLDVPVTLPTGWWIKLTIGAHATVAASIYY